MTPLARAWLVLRAWKELLRYDLLAALGIPGVAQPLPPRPRGTRDRDTERAVADALTLAACFYWKRVLCLQRAVGLVRLLRASGVDALMVIGYRTAPFMSHAWVEVDSAVVADSPAFRDRLLILHVA